MQCTRPAAAAATTTTTTTTIRPTTMYQFFDSFFITTGIIEECRDHQDSMCPKLSSLGNYGSREVLNPSTSWAL